MLHGVLGLPTYSPVLVTPLTPLQPLQTLKLLNRKWGHAGFSLLNPEILQVAAISSWPWGPD